MSKLNPRFLNLNSFFHSFLQYIFIQSNIAEESTARNSDDNEKYKQCYPMQQEKESYIFWNLNKVMIAYSKKLVQMTPRLLSLHDQKYCP